MPKIICELFFSTEQCFANLPVAAEYTDCISVEGSDPLPTSVLDMTIIFTNPSARAGYDTRSIFKRSLTGLSSEFSFS